MITWPPCSELPMLNWIISTVMKESVLVQGVYGTDEQHWTGLGLD